MSMTATSNLRFTDSVAEFDSAQELMAAAHKAHEAGYQKLDAYSPFPDRRLGGSDRLS